MKTEKNIFIAFLLNLIFSLAEFIGGLFTGSIAILSDAVHDFGDATAIGLSFFLEKKSKKQPNEKYTFGSARFSVLGGLISTLILLFGAGFIIYHAVGRFFNPVALHYNGMLILAIVGLFVNLISAKFTHGGHSLNQKAVNLHMLEDAFGWMVVLVGTLVMRFTNFYVLDPILSILLALFILFTSLKNLKEILDVFLIKTPKSIDFDDLKNHLLEIDGVKDAHHFHVWTTDGAALYATLHAVCERYDSEIKKQIKTELKEHGIVHTTIEIELVGETCLEQNCVVETHTHTHHHHHHD